MFRYAALLVAFLLSWNVAVRLSAQSPSKSVTATPSVALPTPSQTPAPTSKSLVDSMDSADLKEAVQFLKNNYIKPEVLNETELNRATFEGILARLGRGVVLLPDSTSASVESETPFFGEVLEGLVAYLRIGGLTGPNLEALDTNLKGFATQKVDALVIDLRASSGNGDFAPAAEFTKRFCPKGKPLFSLRKMAAKRERTFASDRDPSYEGLMIVLVDGDTSGAAEVVAGVIHLYGKALLIGQATAGRAVEYSDLKLSSGKVLRVAVGEAVLPQDQQLFPAGIKPDVPVEMPPVDKREVFQQSREKGMTPFVVENERPHLNEAALISGKNPELEAMEAAQRRGHGPEKATVHDPVLQRALDLVTTIAVFQQR